MSDAIERARQALAHIEAAWEDDDSPLPSDFQAIRDLLAEHDAGVWLDTREMVALGAVNPVALYFDGRDSDTPWEIDADGEGEPYWSVGATAADAVRAAREADR